MALNMQIFHRKKEQATRKHYKIQQQNEGKRRSPILKGKEIQTNQVKPIIILIST
jgi:hypothetical protein